MRISLMYNQAVNGFLNNKQHDIKYEYIKVFLNVKIITYSNRNIVMKKKQI